MPINAPARRATRRHQLGLNLQRCRLRRSLTQEALAQRLRIPAATIRQIENGAGNPTIDQVSMLAFALQVRLGDLFQGT